MEQLKFIFPWDGDFLNKYDGKWQEGALWVFVGVNKYAKINGIETIYSEEKGCYIANIPLYGYRNAVVASNENEEVKITLFALKDNFMKRFRISSDDNILFLKELSEGDYKSIFDHPYLAVYKKAHDVYGAKVHLNLFYAFDDKAQSFFAKRKGYFDLPMMTDRYKKEFIENSNWLKLAFHAKSEYPDRPYKYASGEKIREDYNLVCSEICRFAGSECITNSTTIHWGEANREVVRTLRSMGLRSLTGYFEKDDKGEPLVSYYADIPTVEHVGSRDFWMDTKEDITFGRIDRVLNIGTLNEVLKAVDEISEDRHRGGFVSIMIHEQYFYDDYAGYLSDFERRVLDSCEILNKKGYKASFISEVVNEPEDSENSDS